MANAVTVKNELVSKYGYYSDNLSIEFIRRVISVSNNIDKKNTMKKKMKYKR